MLRMQSCTLVSVALLCLSGCCLGGEGGGAYRTPVPGGYSSATALPLAPLAPGASAGMPATVRYAALTAAVAADGAPDEKRALCWACLFPGGGYFYTGETTRGVILAGVAGGSLLTGALLSGSEYSPGSECVYNPELRECVGGSEGSSSSDRTPLWIGAAVAAGAWAYGILDARGSVNRVNARNGVRVGQFEAFPEPVLQLDREHAPAIGMQLRVRW